MGTNYYAVRNRPTTDEPIHIGKSSSGWRFLFQEQDIWGDPEVHWHTAREVYWWLEKYTVESNEFVIMNEYDEVVTFEDFKTLVEQKQKEKIHDEHAKLVEGYRFDSSWFC